MLKLTSPLTHSPSSTAFVAEVAQFLLHNEIPVSEFRTVYKELFTELAKVEFSFDLPIDKIQFLENALHVFQRHVVDDNGNDVNTIVRNAQCKLEVQTIRGSGIVQPLVLTENEAREWVTQQIAEPGIIDIALSNSQPHPDDILFAIGAGAELSPIKEWLAAGGQVAALMRPNNTRWHELIDFARSSAGTLYVPIVDTSAQQTRQPGVDVVTQLDAAAVFLKHIVQMHPRKLIVGAYMYVGGAAHLIAQACQDALQTLALELHQDTVLTWLATPTDQTPLSLTVADAVTNRYATRNRSTKFRDWWWQRLGLCFPPAFTHVRSGGVQLALRDFAAAKQGPNYLMAKRAQRWRAYLAALQDRQVAYLVTPPARTHSVLSHRILKATYKGAPQFGLHPFEVGTTKRSSAAVLAHAVAHPMFYDAQRPTEIHEKWAIHGGIWRVGYEPSSVWVPATIRGLAGLLS